MNAQKKIQFSDKIGSRDRLSRLLVIPDGGKPYWWGGYESDGIRIESAQFKKDGKWSGTDFVLVVDGATRAIPCKQGWESGKWREGIAVALGLPAIAKWEDIAANLRCGVSDLINDGKVTIPTGPLRVEQDAD